MASGVDTSLDRARATLLGLALGDAMGMPSQTLPREQIRLHYGQITDLVPPYDGHPVSHGLLAGQVTDDTEQSLLLARRLLADPERFDEVAWSHDLLAWEADVRARGLRDLLGPSSKAALEALLAGGAVSESGRRGTTNGAAMRIAPVGIATVASDLNRLVDQVQIACRVTHNTREAIAAASAVAAVISCGIEGAGFEAALAVGITAARIGQTRGHPVGERDMAGRIERALELAETAASDADFADAVGNSVASFESVPAAFGMVHRAGGDVWKTVQLAANIGDDTDTIGAIAGAMAGACRGMAGLPLAKIEMVRTANDLDLDGLAAPLLALRNRPAHPALQKEPAA